MEKKYIISIDQGTTSTRAIVFNKQGNIISIGQKEHEQIFPQAEWVEHDPIEIWYNTKQVIGLALSDANITRNDIASIGITNQRETTVMWDKTTGKPVYNAIVWQDTRTAPIVKELAKNGGEDKYKKKVGLPLNPYFSGTKIIWILKNVKKAQEVYKKGNLLFGNTDTWILWNLTGGKNGGVHITDVTNASRTLLMDLKTLKWDNEILKDFGIDKNILPEIKSSSEVYGHAEDDSLLRKTPISGILGDQQAATFGQTAFKSGETKNTYGTGCFLIFNTGKKIIQSKNGLLTTVAYKIGDKSPRYALEGSIPVTGSLVQWLRDNIGLIKNSSDISKLATTVSDNGGIYFVPAFSGLFAPRWRMDARGTIVGMTRFINKGHIARAAIESTAYQTKEVFDAILKDSGVKFNELKVDGGATHDELLMQFQADILDVPVVRPKVAETTALGAAYAAGLAVGFWSGKKELKMNWAKDKDWKPKMESKKRIELLKGWNKAVEKSLNWV